MDFKERNELIEKGLGSFSAVVKEYRIKNGMTISDLSKKTGISPSYLLRMEQNKKNPTNEIRVKILEQVMGLSPEDINLYLEKVYEKDKLNRE